MKTKMFILFCSLCMWVVQVYGQYNWPMVSGGRERTSWAKNETELTPPFEAVYYNQFSGGTQLSYGDGILLIGDNSWVHAIDEEANTEMWTFQIPNAGGAIGSVPALTESFVLCGGQGGEGLFALDKTGGTVAWSKPIGSLYDRNPIPDGDRIYVVQDSVYCLDIQDGSTIWTYPMSGQITPTVDDSTVFIRSVALDKFTGEFKWQGDYNGGNLLTVDEDYVYADASESEIAAYRKADGQNQWSYTIPDGTFLGYSGGSGAMTDTYLCFVVWLRSDTTSALYTLDKETGAYVWHHVFDDKGIYRPMIANDIVYLTDWDNHDLWGFDISTGDVLLRDDSDEYWYQPIVANHTLFALIYWGGVKAFRKTGTSIETIGAAGPPTSMHLFQNYPNPFNPETAISYQLSAVRERITDHSPLVTLKIYNLLGQEVRTLVDEAKGAGYYTATWDGRDHSGRAVASGIYLYRLQAGEVTETREMMLLK